MTNRGWTRSLLGVSLAAAFALMLGAGGAAAKDEHHDDNEHNARGLTIGVIGDMPYTAQQQAALATFVDAISADPNFQVLIHLGDIKSGSSASKDTYMKDITVILHGYAGASV